MQIPLFNCLFNHIIDSTIIIIIIIITIVIIIMYHWLSDK